MAAPQTKHPEGKMALLKLEDGTEVEAFTADEVKAQISEATSGLENKVNELLGETKSAKQKARELEEAQKNADLERQKEKGEFKSLYESEQKAKLELQEKHDSLVKSIQQKDIDIAINDIASEVAKTSQDKAKALAKLIKENAKYGEDGVNFEIGGVKVDRQKMIDHARESFPFLADASGADGGGARGSNANGSADKTVKRSEFDNMTQPQRSEFAKSGGKVIDD